MAAEKLFYPFLPWQHRSYDRMFNLYDTMIQEGLKREWKVYIAVYDDCFIRACINIIWNHNCTEQVSSAIRLLLLVG